MVEAKAIHWFYRMAK